MKFAALLPMLALVVSVHAQTNFPGYIDASFTARCVSNAAFNNTVKGLLVQADAKIIGGGSFLDSFPSAGRACQNALFRCDSNGVSDGTFSSPFSSAYTFPDINAILPVTGAKILIVGNFFINNVQHSVARLNSNGGVDGAFTLSQTAPAGIQNVTYAAATFDTSGRIVVGGTAIQQGISKGYLKRLTASGAEDGTFTGGGIVTTGGFGGIKAVAVQADNKIIIGGLFAQVGAATRYALARMNEDGTLDDTFNAGFNNFSQVGALKVLADGKILVAGSFSTNGTIYHILARLNSDGSFDPSFTLVNGGAINATALAVQTDGKIIVAHSSGASRFSAGGPVDANYFQGAGDIANHGFKCVALDASGRALVGGEDAASGAVARRGLIRLFGGNAPVPTPPSIDVQPTDQNAFAGGSATFSVGASGSEPLSYAWFFGGANNGGSATVTFSGLVLGHDNTPIYCIVTNQYGRATSSVVRLHVSAAPVAPMITANPVSATVSNPTPITAAALTEGDLRGKILRLHILNGAMPFPSSGNYDIVLAASGNTYAIPGGGAMGASAGDWSFGSDLGIDTVLALHNSFPGGGPVKVALLTNGTYEMYGDGVVNNQNGTYTLAFADGTPVGPTVTFTTAATGTAPFTYTWLFNGSPIAPTPGLVALSFAAAPAGKVSGESTATLTISNATTLNAGHYSVLISNVAGRATSAVATLTVNGFSGGVTDSTAPSLVLKTPALAVKTIGSNHITFAGIATDNVGLAGVFFSVNGGSIYAATGASNWTADVPLTPGTNTIRVRAEDLLGNAVTNLRMLVYLPVIPLAGAYNGLFFDTNNPAHTNAGGFSLALKADGTFKGKLQTGLPFSAFAGKFGLDLTATTTVPRAGLSTLSLTLHLANGRLEGTVSDGANWTSFLAAYKSGPVGALAGKYTLLLPGSTDSSNFPGGDGSDALTLSAAGRLSGLGALGEGSPINLITTVAPGGQMPVYSPLYGGAGSLFGWLTVADTAGSDIVGTLHWTKPPSAGLYAGGFVTNVLAAGSRFVPPPRLTPALNLTNGVVVLDGGNLTNVLTIPVTLGGDNRITGPNGLTLIISTAKGTITGSFIDPATSAKRTIKGVILSDQNFGGGEFIGPSQSGGLFLGNQP